MKRHGAGKNMGIHVGTFVTERGEPLQPHRLLAELRRRAEQGDASAQNDLGCAYAAGMMGVSRDANAALKWFRKAADQGLPQGLGNLGKLLLPDGAGEKDAGEALTLLRRAVELGDSQGMCHLAWAYRFGVGVEQDFAKAAELYRQAADRENPAGWSGLACLHMEGEGVPQDKGEALRLSRLAAERDDPLGLYLTGTFYFDGAGGAPQDDAVAAEWFRRSAEAGFDAAQDMMGMLCETGRGVPKDAVESRRWCTLASGQGNVQSLKRLARLMANGIGGPKNVVKGLECVRRAAECGDAESVLSLALASAYGIWVPQNDVLALKGIRQAAEVGWPNAQFALGRLYENGAGGVQSDSAEARRWFELAAKQGHVGASLALCYPHTPLVLPTSKLSLEWRSAFFNALSGHRGAMYTIGHLFRTGCEWTGPCFEEAVRWLMMSAKQGLGEAAVELASACKDARSNMSAESCREIVRLLQPFAEQGEIGAQKALGHLMFGWAHSGVKHPFVEAAKWVRMAAEQGDANAQNFLGTIYYNLGESGPNGRPKQRGKRSALRNTREILRDFRQRTIARRLFWITRNAYFLEARNWYQKAADQNFPEAYANLGDFSFDGIGGVPRDDREAYRLYSAAAKLGDRLGKAGAGMMLLKGWGCEKDEGRGSSLLREAGEMGLMRAKIAFRLFGKDGELGSLDEMTAWILSEEMVSLPIKRAIREWMAKVCFGLMYFLVTAVVVVWTAIYLWRWIYPYILDGLSLPR